MPSYLDSNENYFAHQYAAGYGVVYPESHVVRLYHAVLKNRFGPDRREPAALLDFGCGSGAHALFFQMHGFDVHGVDIDSRAIERCREKMPDQAAKFRTIGPKPDGRPYFDASFDVVFSNQALYYLDRDDLDLALEVLHRQLKPGGIFFATMMSSQHDYFGLSTPRDLGLRRVERPTALSNTAPASFEINFMESEEQLVNTFRLFKRLHVGYYDAVIREDLGNSHHYIFVGTRDD